MDSNHFNELQHQMERARRGIVSELVHFGMMEEEDALRCGIEFETFTYLPKDDKLSYFALIYLSGSGELAAWSDGATIEFGVFEPKST
jgi:hypothetical protein